MSKAPVRVLITGAAGQIAYSLIPLFCGGEVLGPDQPVFLHLLDIERAKAGLDAVVMELVDCAYPLLAGVTATVNVEEGFKGIDVAVLLGGFPRLQGMTRADLLAKNSGIFVEQGTALGKFANPNCKVLVVANPANTNCLVAYKAAVAAGSKIPAKNFTCLTRLDQNRAVGQVCLKLADKGVTPSQVQKVVIWGNHSADQFPDVSNGVVTIEGKQQKITEALKHEEKFLTTEFIPTVQNRGSSVIKARGKSSALSAANASKDHLHSWLVGTKEGEWASMGVVTDGTFYDLPEGIVFSVPTTCKSGDYTVVKGCTWSEEGKARIETNIKKLQEEGSVASKKQKTSA